MSSVQFQRELINDQLTHTEETFTEFKEIVIKSEEEMDFTRTSQIVLHRKDLLQHNIIKEEPYKQERSFTPDQEELKPLQVKQEDEKTEYQQIKEEQEELDYLQIKVEEDEVYYSQGEEQLALKQETDAYYEQTEPEPNRTQVIFQEPAEAENQNQERSNDNNFGAKRDEEKKHKRHQKTRQHVSS
ncbi:hypothetical protein CCH79_00020689 [Gambusia affinis]|uniref:Uncharacterized protein n=1 Tax=Gambusia affinis TaxID=33528 RepID=A0A315VUA3_GAMAF|nr:hypothetical protein CCH79_00020689 [Gambusia affinis]